MLAVSGALPGKEAGWTFELKWDGVRALASVEEGRVTLGSRNGRDITAAYPELQALGPAVAPRRVLLDGEIVAVGEGGTPSFSLLQQRMHVADRQRAAQLALRVPVTYIVFDLLDLDGRSTMALPHHERRSLLESLQLAGAAWATPPSLPGPAQAALDGARRGGFEGVVAKRSGDPYRPGRRSDGWIKAKTFRSQEVVVGGWTPGTGRRQRSLGALLMGLPEPGGRLRYVGKVGTGFSDAALADLGEHLAALRRPESPFAGPLPPAQTAGASWVEPRLVGEVRYSEWTPDGRLRHPAWRGLRSDKGPEEVVAEEPGRG